MKPNVTSFFDNATNTISYVVADPNDERLNGNGGLDNFNGNGGEY